MPLFDYRCGNGHTEEHIRSTATRDLPMRCACGEPLTRVEISGAHVPPDGVYSYEPNLGSAEDFERRHEAQRRGEKVYDR